MATMNPFDLLDDDTEDPSFLIASVEQQKLEKPKKAPASTAAQAQPVSLPSSPPSHFLLLKLLSFYAVREAKNEPGRGRGLGRGSSGFNRDSRVSDNSNGFSGGYRPSEEGGRGKQFERRGNVGPRGSFRGGRRWDFNNAEAGEGEHNRRQYEPERHSGTGRGSEFKRDGAGRGNWVGATDKIAPKCSQNEKKCTKEQFGKEDAADANKENAANESKEKEPENKEMTLEEYEKIHEEKRKALIALKTEGREVDAKEFESMHQLSNKKSNDDIFIKLSVSINEFLKPAEGEYYGHGRGRGGPRGGNTASNVSASAIEDPGQFPALGGK
ncbi:Alpha/beta-Hydrolases superfamily protein [Hibiscus syriacus]|uniref:Alpha/beta-Hydrolases superfamily protein n=1 Tax=Hibiscus syriacus TaxID=106335 RepID=A0A6A2X9S4_HIBSY|nr:Alpha/beta-Hydrolases superfamily protein [Hibiscus syriacus]